MACTTVTATSGGGGNTPDRAITSAVDFARTDAKAVCASSGGDCKGISATPENIELLELRHDVGEHSGIEWDTWYAEVKCTFRCKRTRGCSPFASHSKSDANVKIDIESLKKNPARSELKTQT